MSSTTVTKMKMTAALPDFTLSSVISLSLLYNEEVREIPTAIARIGKATPLRK